MEYLKANGTEYPARFCGKQIDRDWDGCASKTVTLSMPYAQAAQLFVDGLSWAIVRRETGADENAAVPEQDCCAGSSSGVRPAQMMRRRSRTAPATASQARSRITATGRSRSKWAAIRSWSRRCGSWRRR